RSFCEAQDVKTTIPLFCIVLAFLSVTVSPQARGVTPAPDGGYPNQNTAEGDNALFNLDTSQGENNTAIGFNALYTNTITGNNTAVGSNALYSDTIGGANNTAIGAFALQSNTTGVGNIAIGFGALLYNSTGGNNIALG